MNRIGGIYRMNGILGGGMLERTRTYFEVGETFYRDEHEQDWRDIQDERDIGWRDA